MGRVSDTNNVRLLDDRLISVLLRYDDAAMQFAAAVIQGSHPRSRGGIEKTLMGSLFSMIPT
jgi:hypothetical protein